MLVEAAALFARAAEEGGRFLRFGHSYGHSYPALSPPSLSSFALSRPNVASPLIHPVFSLPHISFSKPSPILVAAEGLPDDSNISTQLIRR